MAALLSLLLFSLVLNQSSTPPLEDLREPASLAAASLSRLAPALAGEAVCVAPDIGDTTSTRFVIDFQFAPDWFVGRQTFDEDGVGMVLRTISYESLGETLVYYADRRRGVLDQRRLTESGGPMERMLSPAPYLRRIMKLAEADASAVDVAADGGLVRVRGRDTRALQTTWTFDAETSRLLAVESRRPGGDETVLSVTFEDWRSLDDGREFPFRVTTLAPPATATTATLTRVENIDPNTPYQRSELPLDALITELATGKLFNGRGEEVPATQGSRPSLPPVPTPQRLRAPGWLIGGGLGALAVALTVLWIRRRA